MRIQHNIAAINSNRQLATNNGSVSKNLEKLSSGYRINRAGDDAAGLAISEKMRVQITGLETAQKNANDGISLVQTAEGALTEVHSMLNRMVELADQSANGTYQDKVDRENLQKEVTSLKSEVNRISESTNFNGINLLDGSMGTSTGAPAGMPVVSGTLGSNVITNVAGATMKPGETVTVSAGTNAYELSVETKQADGSSVTSIINLNDYTTITSGTNAGKTLADAATPNQLSVGESATIDLTSVGLGKIDILATADDVTAADSLVTDLTTAIGTDAAYAGPTGGGSGLTLQIGDTADSFNQLSVNVGSMGATELGIDVVDISTQSGATEAIDKIKDAINTVSSTRGDLGALQNRLEHTINNLSVTSENMTAAESRIRDVDMAKEMMDYTKNNILVQASQAMLAQANQVPQGVLQLLK